MNSYYQAYQSYERRRMLGMYDIPPSEKPANRISLFVNLMSKLGDLLIHAGLGLKRHYTAGRTMVYSPLSGHKP